MAANIRKFFATVPAVLIITAIVNGNEGRFLHNKILGGADAPENEYPYMVSLRYLGEHNCGGSIIDHEWIVTAAHCVDGFPMENLVAVVGSTKLSAGGSTYSIITGYIHEHYDSTRVKNDVAILKVAAILFSNQINSIKFDRLHIGGEQSCTLIGWGYTTYQVIGNKIPNNLQQISLKTITIQECQDYKLSVDDNQLCTFTRSGEGFCTHDSGGPLVINSGRERRQIGIVSWMMACARGYPDVYSRVSSYAEWFNQKCNCVN